MRLAPVAIVGATEDPDLSRVRFRESSMTTHANPLCIEACEFLGVTLEHLMYGFSEYLWLPTDNGYWHPKFKPLLNRSFMSGKAKGTGYVLDSLEAALWAFATSSSFEEAVLKAVNLGNDADTTGAVCGQLAGARWGLSGIPDHLIDGLAQFEMIYDVAKKLVDAKW